jgi:GNAT superfamily N-acetyltransferase
VVAIRPLDSSELDRVVEVDVSEQGSFVFRWTGDQLVVVPKQHARPPHRLEDWEPDVHEWVGMLQEGGSALGAFDGEALIGFAVMRVRLTEDTAQLAALYVDASHRRQGVARALVEWTTSLAAASGARHVYVSATPSESAVGFYRSMGFVPTSRPHPELFQREPEDIHMLLAL